MEESNKAGTASAQASQAAAAAAAAKQAEEALKARYSILKGHLSSCSAALGSLIASTSNLYSCMKKNIIIDGKTIEEEQLDKLKNTSESIKGNIDSIISIVSGKC